MVSEAAYPWAVVTAFIAAGIVMSLFVWTDSLRILAENRVPIGCFLTAYGLMMFIATPVIKIFFGVAHIFTLWLSGVCWLVGGNLLLLPLMKKRRVQELNGQQDLS